MAIEQPPPLTQTVPHHLVIMTILLLAPCLPPPQPTPIAHQLVTMAVLLLAPCLPCPLPTPLPLQRLLLPLLRVVSPLPMPTRVRARPPVHLPTMCLVLRPLVLLLLVLESLYFIFCYITAHLQF